MFAGPGRLARARARWRSSRRWPSTGWPTSGWRRGVVAVGDTRGVGKADMPVNDACPEIRVEPDTFEVWVDGDEIEPAPVAELPLAQRYSLF